MICEKCKTEYFVKYASGRFCSSKCAHSFCTQEKRKEINEKVRTKLSVFIKVICKICSVEFTTRYKKQKVCFSNICKEQDKKIRSSLVREKNKKNQAIVGRGKYNRNPQSLYDLSTRTASKVLQRLSIGCSRCGWNEASCDLHHIYGRKVEDANHHRNLTYICPNCHRLFHQKKIGPNDVQSLEKQVGDKWKQFYYG